MPDGATLAAFEAMRCIAALALVCGCVVGSESTPSGTGAGSDPVGSGPEIDGVYLNIELGTCQGGVGGAIACSGSPCDVIEDATSCAGTASCFVGLNDDASFRDCFPVDKRATAAGTCAQLTAPECATREDCTAVYQGPAFYGSFVRCQDEAP